MPKKLNLPFILFSILILLACFLLFKNLSNMSLWSDEGSHAVFARSVLEFGYPRVYDGHVWQYPRFLNRPDVNISNPAAAWTYHTWLPYYATALSFFLFGQNTFAARLPSALLGLGSLILVGLLTRQWFENRKWASVLTVLLVLCSVPFLLHIRQARYFSYMIFFVLLSFVTYNTYVKHKNGLYLCLFLFSLFGLFFSNQGVFMPVFATLGLFALTFDKTSWNKKSLITVILVAILFTTPWFLQAKSSNHIILELNHAWKNVQLFIRSITKYIFPLVAWLLVFLYYGVRKQNFFFKLENEEKKNLLRIAIFVMMSTVLIALQSERSFRYFIQLVPFFLIIEGFLLSVWFSQKRVAPAIFLILTLFTSFLTRPANAHFYFFNYLDEITHDYDGPVEGISRYLKEHSKPGETCKIAYEELPVSFYVPWLQIENGNFFNTYSFPEWIVMRSYWVTLWKKIKMNQGVPEAELDHYLSEIEQKYDKIELSVPDLVWDNRPDEIDNHHFRTVVDGPRVVIYRRKSA